MQTVPHQPGCQVKPAIAAKPTVVSVNGVTIAREAIARETQHHPAARPIEAWQAAARALAVRELLLQEARRLALVAEPIGDDRGRRETDEEALIRQLLAREVVTPEPDEATCRRYFEQNRPRFRSPDLYEVSHILVPLPRDAEADAQLAAEACAASILKALAVDPAAFPALAGAHSACPSRAVGGALGQIGPGQTVPEFENALPALPVGVVAPQPVRSRYGVHIVRVDRYIAGEALPFATVADRIARFLTRRVRQVAERHYLGQLAGRATVTGVSLPASLSPLVQ